MFYVCLAIRQFKEEMKHLVFLLAFGIKRETMSVDKEGGSFKAVNFHAFK